MFHIDRPTHLILCNDITGYIKYNLSVDATHTTEHWQIAVDAEGRVVARLIKDDGQSQNEHFLFASSLEADDWEELLSSSPYPISSVAWDGMLKGEKFEVYDISFKLFNWRDAQDRVHNIVMFGNTEYGAYRISGYASQLATFSEDTAEYYFHSVAIPDEQSNAVAYQLSIGKMAYKQQRNNGLTYHLRDTFARLAAGVEV